jgi:hypothetical protein
MASSRERNDRLFTSTPRHRTAAVATPSTRWKETLRRACLDRARQKRRDLVMRKRRQFSFCESNDGTNQSAFSVVEEELRKSGVGIVSSDDKQGARKGSESCVMSSEEPFSAHVLSKDEEGEIAGREDVQGLDAMDVDDARNDFIGYTITEDDLNDILEDVEEELGLNGNQRVQFLSIALDVKVSNVCSFVVLLIIRGSIFGRSVGS